MTRFTRININEEDKVSQDHIAKVLEAAGHREAAAIVAAMSEAKAEPPRTVRAGAGAAAADVRHAGRSRWPHAARRDARRRAAFQLHAAGRGGRTMSAVEQLKDLEREIVEAGARQRELQQGKSAAVHAVREKDEALVRALEANLDGSPGATVAEKALIAARKRAEEPWDARIEAAGRLVSQAQRRRSQFVAGNLAQLLDEMGAPAKGLDGAGACGTRRAREGRRRIRDDRAADGATCA